MGFHGSEWNAGKMCGCAQVVLAVGAAAGYFYARDYRRALYWVFVACIEGTITL